MAAQNQKTVTIEAHTRVLSTDPNRLGKYDNLISYITSDGHRGRIRIPQDQITDFDIQNAVKHDLQSFQSKVGLKFNYT